jgi:hypothetical protein
MSQPSTQFAQQQPQFVVLPVQQSNGLGVAGFFIALIGLFIPTGIVALLGLLISLVALGRAPRGFAAMGVFIGLLGTAIWAAVTIAVVLGGLAIGIAALVAVSLGFYMINPELIEFTRDMGDVCLAVIEYEDEEGALPTDLAVLGLSVPTLTDPWGRPYHFELVEDAEFGYEMTSSGGDGEFGTADDLVMSRIDRVWEEAFESFGHKMEELGQRMERMNRRASSGHFSYTHSTHDRAEHYKQAAIAASEPEPHVQEALASEAPDPPEVAPEDPVDPHDAGFPG